MSAYETFDDLLGYCRLSADPVGRLVLAVFGATDPRTVRLSDRVCTALQLLEFWQDVAEDRRDGRVYLPAESMRAHGVTGSDLDAPRASPSLRRLLADETWRAESLLDSGSELLGLLHGWARVAVAGYVAAAGRPHGPCGGPTSTCLHRRLDPGAPTLRCTRWRCSAGWSR